MQPRHLRAGGLVNAPGVIRFFVGYLLHLDAGARGEHAAQLLPAQPSCQTLLLHQAECVLDRLPLVEHPALDVFFVALGHAERVPADLKQHFRHCDALLADLGQVGIKNAISRVRHVGAERNGARLPK